MADPNTKTPANDHPDGTPPPKKLDAPPPAPTSEPKTFPSGEPRP